MLTLCVELVIIAARLEYTSLELLLLLLLLLWSELVLVVHVLGFVGLVLV